MFCKSITVFFVFTLLLFVTQVQPRMLDLYYEKRIQNSTIEQRLNDWYNRTLVHAHTLNISENPNITRWREQLAELTFTDEVAGLLALNRFINEDVLYVDDYHHYHKSDFWADPETTLTEGGDCEDIALVKAATLQRYSWPEDRMHLLIGYLTERGKREAHAVLLVETSNGEQWIMRSLSNDIVKPSEFPFLPIYAVDHKGTLIVKAHHITM